MNHSPSQPPLIELINVEKRYVMGDETIIALDKVNLQIRENDYVALTGVSGSGKSTLMNILGCLDRPTAGCYRLKGGDVAGMGEKELARLRNREIGFIFQSFNLLPRASALENVVHPLSYRGMRPAERRRLAEDALNRVGLLGRKEHLPNQLSGGQRQRVAIARALVTGPALILADEPTGNLDSRTTEDIMGLFDVLRKNGHTIVIVTHEHEIAEHCEIELIMRDGKIVDRKQRESLYVATVI